MRRPEGEFPPVGWWTWWGLAPVGAGIGRAVWRLRVDRRAPLPTGPLVVAANHYSHLDPPLVGVAIGRPIRFLALDELFGLSVVFDVTTKALGAIPISRTRPPLGALRASLEHLGAGGVVGLFPEGRRVRAWGESAPKRGAAWLAVRSGAPLVPVAVIGTDRAFGLDARRISRAPIRVVVGGPLDPRRFADRPDPVGEMTEAWRQWVAGVLGEA